MANDKTPSPENKVASAYVEVTTTGIPEVKQQLEQVKKAAEDVATSQESGQKKAAAATKQTEGSFDDLVKALSGDAKRAVDKANESMAGGQKKVADAAKETASQFEDIVSVSGALTAAVAVVGEMADKLFRINEQLAIMQLRAAQLQNRGNFNDANSPMTSSATQSYAGMDPLSMENLKQEIDLRQADVLRDEAIQAWRRQVGDFSDPINGARTTAVNVAASAIKTIGNILPGNIPAGIGISDDPKSEQFVPGLFESIGSNLNADTRRKELNDLRRFRSSFSPRLQGARAGSFTTQSNYEQQRGTLDAMQNMTLNDSSEATQELLRQILSELKRGSMRP